MWDDLNGVIGVGKNGKGDDVFLTIKVGRLYYEKDEVGGPYIQVICSIRDNEKSEAVGDIFETDDLRELAEDLRDGVLPWYGDVIRFHAATPEERMHIARHMGW